MWGPFGRSRRRTGREEALERALSALGNVRRRYGRSRSSRGGGGRGGRAYGGAVGIGIGVLAMVLTILLLIWVVRRKAKENAPTSPAEEEGVGGEEAAPPEETV